MPKAKRSKTMHMFLDGQWYRLMELSKSELKKVRSEGLYPIEPSEWGKEVSVKPIRVELK